MDLVTLFCAGLIALIAYLLKVKSEDRIATYVNKLPGPYSLPFIGTAWVIILTPREDFYRLARQRLRRYGKVMRTWLGNMPVVHFIAPEYAELVLNNSVQITKSLTYRTLHPWLGLGLLTSTGERWHRHRKLITPTFHFKILESFMEVFVEKSQILTKQLEAKADGNIHDIYPDITHCALDIICKTAMGVEMNAMYDKGNKYVEAVYGISELIIRRMIRPWLHSDMVFYKSRSGRSYRKHLSTLHDFARKVISDKKTATSSHKKPDKINDEDDALIGKKKRMAFLDLLIEASENGTVLSDADIREEVDTFMFEGHDTTTAGICWTLFLLGNHPEIQEEVYQEIEGLFQGEDKTLTVTDLGELKLLERCIKEALRLYPSVPVIGRTLSEDIKAGDYLIPAGCTVNVHIFLLHREEEYFPEPDSFKPDRFLPENTADRHPYAYIPFSAGPRNCIGQKFAMYEEKTLLAYILRKFRVKAVDNHETVRPIMDLVLRPKNGLKVVLERRNKS